MDEQKSSTWPKYAVYSLVVIVILLLILILILYLIKSPLLYRSSAYSLAPSGSQVGTVSSLSLDNSYIFSSPLRAKAGSEKIRATVFILDDRGLGISGKKVTISSNPDSLTITAIQASTDGQGRATFDVSAGTTGTYTVEAVADGVSLTQKAIISFD